MKQHVFRSLLFVLLYTVASMANPFFAFGMKLPGAPDADIVFVIDVSGSMDRTDPNQYARDALRLGVDLAPDHSRVGIVSVSDRVVLELPLTDVTTGEGRLSAKSYINSLYTDGNTNFLPGIQRAAEMLSNSTASQKRVIFLGDFGEGGYNLNVPASQMAESIGSAMNRAAGSGIQIDMLLFGDAPANSVTASQYTAMPGITGGTLFEVSNPNRLGACIEEIYFNNNSYFKTVYTLRGESAQTLQVSMPTDQVSRARIYISASNPVQSFGATYAGAALDGETTSSYAIVHLERPAQEGVSVTVSPGQTGVAYIYLFLEYDIELAVSYESETELSDDGKEYIQTATIQAEIVDSQTGKPLVAEPFANDIRYSLQVYGSDGQAPIEYDEENSTIISFIVGDGDFGGYEVSAELIAGDFTFTPSSRHIVIEDVRDVIEPIPWALYIAIFIAALFILSASIFAVKHKKKEAEYQGAVEMASDYQFHGKLSVYAVMLDGGNRELRPYDFALHTISEKRITLREILDSVGARDTFAGAEDILLLVGPEDSIVVRNNSSFIQLRVGGRQYGYRAKAQLFYSQKVYIIFEKDENELEITYRKVREEDPAPVRFNIRSGTV